MIKKEKIIENYISEVKKQTEEDDIVIDNSYFTKPCSPRMEAISDVHDGSTGEIRKGYFTVEAAVLSKDKKMPVLVFMRKYFLLPKKVLSVQPMKIYAV